LIRVFSGLTITTTITTTQSVFPPELRLRSAASMAKEYEIGGFMEEVKSVFHDDDDDDDKRGNYEEFVKDMNNFKNCMNDHRMATILPPVQEFKQRVNKVLKGHKHLILGFNAYMKHYRIRLPIPPDSNDSG
jgi:histone deacetylase complex regulatory component SIN3